MIWLMEITKIYQEEPSLIRVLRQSIQHCHDKTKDIYQRGLASMVYKFFDKKAKS